MFRPTRWSVARPPSDRWIRQPTPLPDDQRAGSVVGPLKLSGLVDAGNSTKEEVRVLVGDGLRALHRI
jgi:hypothetical protein